METLKASIERGDEPPVGRTAKQVTGFKGRSGRTFRAKLKIAPREDDEGKWRVDFDEEWATGEPPPPREGEAPAAAATEDWSRSAPTQWPPRPADRARAQRGTTRNTRPVRLTAYNRPTPSSPKDTSAFTRNPSSRSPAARGRRSRAVRTRPVHSSA